MQKYFFSYSESLVLTLCKEIDYIRNRSKNINYSLKTCQNKILSIRLRSELNKLNNKRLKILNISERMNKLNYEKLSIEFLVEIAKRSNCFQQI